MIFSLLVSTDAAVAGVRSWLKLRPALAIALFAAVGAVLGSIVTLVGDLMGSYVALATVVLGLLVLAAWDWHMERAEPKGSNKP